MAVAFTGAGTATAASGASPQAVTTATALAVGDILVALLSYDNSGGSGADPMTGTLTPTPVTGALSASLSAQTGLNDPGAASAGVAARCVAWKVTTAIPSGTVINFAWSGTVVVRSLVLMKVTGAGSTINFRSNSGATGANTVGATTLAHTTPSVPSGDGVLCWAAHENGAAITGDADTTNGSWSAVYGAFSGSGATGMAAYFQSKVVTATATQTFNPTGTSSDWIAGSIVFTELVAVTPATRSTTWKTLARVTATRSTTWSVRSPIAAPTAITTGAVTATSVALSWTAPAGTITDYIIEYATGVSDNFNRADGAIGGEWTVLAGSTGTVSISGNKLVVADSGGGDGIKLMHNRALLSDDQSIEIACTTPNSGGNFGVVFRRSAALGGTGYRLVAKDGLGGGWVHMLTEDAPWNAVTAFGSSSAPEMAYGGPPYRLQAKVVGNSFTSQVDDVEWFGATTDSTYASGKYVGFNINTTLDDFCAYTGSWTAFAHTASATAAITVTGLSPNTSYTFRVRAKNGATEGLNGLATSVVTPAGAPAEVTGLTAPSIGSTSTGLSWAAPANGGSAIVDYRVENTTGNVFDPYGKPEGALAGWLSFNGWNLGVALAAKPGKFVVLDPGGSYSTYFTNSRYTTALSRGGHIIKGRFTASAAGEGIGLFFNAAVDGSTWCALKVFSDGTWWYVYEGGLISASSAGALVFPPNGEFDLEVNATVMTAPVFKFNGTTIPGTFASDKTGNYVGVALDNGSTVDNIEIGGVTWTAFSHVASPATTMTVTGLTPDTTYSHRVSAINAIGTGPVSASLLVTQTPLGNVYRYYRLRVTAVRTPLNDTNQERCQVAEWNFRNAAGTRIVPSSYKALGAQGFEDPDSFDDGNTSTKWNFYTAGYEFVWDFGSAVLPASYTWWTASDASQRDPVSWVIEASSNGQWWTTVDTVTNAAITTNRTTNTGVWPITPPVEAPTPTRGGYLCQYVRFTPTAVLSGVDGQFAEFHAMSQGQRIASASVSGAAGAAGNVDDYNIWSKAYANPFANLECTLNLGSIQYIDGYRWYTGNDNETTRSPKSWRVDVSTDNSTWVTMDTKTNYATPQYRTFLVGPFGPFAPTVINRGESTNGWSSGGAQQRISHAAFTPAAGSILVCMPQAQIEQTSGGSATLNFRPPTDTFGDTGGTAWVQGATSNRGPAGAFNWGESCDIWTRKIGASPGSGVITILANFDGTGIPATSDGTMWMAVAEVPAAYAGTIGAVANQAPALSTTSYDIVLGSAPAADSIVFSAYMQDFANSKQYTLPTGFTLLHDQYDSTAQQIDAAAYKVGSVPQTHTWSGLEAVNRRLGCAVEIKAPTTPQDATHPKLYYNFNGTGTTEPDQTGNGQTGAMYGSSSDTPSDLHSSGQLLITSGGSLKYLPTTTPVVNASLTFKFRPAQTNGNCNLWVLAIGNDTSGFNFTMNQDHLEFIGRTVTDLIISGSISGTTMVANTDYQIAATCDGSRLRIYLNGVEKYSEVFRGALRLDSDTNSGFRVGYNPYLGSVNGSYLFDDIRWWDDYTLTPAEVLAIASPTPVVYSDDFNRADNAWLGSEWIGQGANWSIVSNQAVRGGGFGDFAVLNHAVGSSDMWVEADCYRGGYTVVNLRGPDPNSTVGEYGYLGFVIPAGGYEIGRVASGYATIVTLAGGGEPSPTRIRLEAEGSTLRLYADGVLKITTTDTTISTGQYAGINAGGDPSNKVDNFRCGALPYVPAGATTTPVTASRSTTWKVNATVTATKATYWNVQARITATRATTWNTLAKVAATASRATTWKTLATVTASRATTWNVAAATAPLWTAVAHTKASAPDGGDTFTTSAIDTATANLLIVGVADQDAGGVLTDSKSNVWTLLTGPTTVNPYVRLYYAKNPTVGTGHTFTLTGKNYGNLFVQAWKGADITAPADQFSQANTGFSLSVQPGSITPSGENYLVVSAFGYVDTAVASSVDGGFTISDQALQINGSHFGGGMGYLLQGTAAAANPTWSGAGATYTGAVIASFKLGVAPTPPGGNWTDTDFTNINSGGNYANWLQFGPPDYADGWSTSTPGQITGVYSFGGINATRTTGAATTNDQYVKMSVNDTNKSWTLSVRATDTPSAYPGYSAFRPNDSAIYWYKDDVFMGLSGGLTFPDTTPGTAELRCVNDVCSVYQNGTLIVSNDFSAAPLPSAASGRSHQSFGVANPNPIIYDAEGGNYPAGGGPTTTPVTATRSTTWKVNATVTANRATTWKTAASVTATRATIWNTLTSVPTATRSTTWVTRFAVTKAVATTWQTLVPVSAVASRSTTWVALATITPATRSTTWKTLVPAGTAARSTTWAVLISVTASRSTTWGVKQGVIASRTTLWNTAGSLIQVSASRSTSWATFAPVTASRATSWATLFRMTAAATRSTTWATLAPLTANRATTWQTLVPVAGVASRSTSWVTRQLVTGTRLSTWQVRTPIAPASVTTTWNDRAVVTASRTTNWAVAGALNFVTTSILTTWNTKFAVSQTRTTNWVTLAKVAGTMQRATTWGVLVQVPVASRTTTWAVRFMPIASVTTSWNVAGPTFFISKSLTTNWAVLTGVSRSRTTSWTTYTVVTMSRTTAWETRRLLSAAFNTTWRTRVTVQTSRTTTWKIDQRLVIHHATAWKVLPAAAVSNWLTLHPDTVAYKGDHRILAIYQGTTKIWTAVLWGVQERMLLDTPPSLSSSGIYCVGSWFDVLAPGRVTHFRYWARDTAPVTLSLWSGAHVKLATITVTPSAIGWREALLPTPYEVGVGSYVISRMVSGPWSYSDSFAHAPSPHLSNPLGRYAIAIDGEAFPDGSADGINYLVDVVYELAH